ncbi:type II toxin-antitoxin system RelE/ParE family toxin [Thalassospira sp.]|uniref:type II toxin-antitoxin system RelE/ParE family toxin n=1 Tax=Thalassospira sp. TaxID=1912094 RepID=UPI0032ED538C
MAYEITYAADAERDFNLIFDFLVESYIGFGEDIDSAISHAQERLFSIQKDIEKLGNTPYCGTLHNDILPNLRHVTLGQAIIWFDVIEEPKNVRILAVFFGGQDHFRHMLTRLLS